MNSSIFTVWSYNVNVAIMGILALLPDAAPASYNLVMADAGLLVRVGTKYPSSQIQLLGPGMCKGGAPKISLNSQILCQQN